MHIVNPGEMLCGRYFAPCYAAKLRCFAHFFGTFLKPPRAMFRELILGSILENLSFLG